MLVSLAFRGSDLRVWQAVENEPVRAGFLTPGAGDNGDGGARLTLVEGGAEAWHGVSLKKGAGLRAQGSERPGDEKASCWRGFAGSNLLDERGSFLFTPYYQNTKLGLRNCQLSFRSCGL